MKKKKLSRSVFLVPQNMKQELLHVVYTHFECIPDMGKAGKIQLNLILSSIYGVDIRVGEDVFCLYYISYSTKSEF